MSVTAQGLQLEKDVLKRNSEDRKKIFAVALQRPFFLRFSAIFLFVIALGSMVYYAIVSDAKAFALQALGYFVGLWAIRQMLGSGGPSRQGGSLKLLCPWGRVRAVLRVIRLPDIIPTFEDETQALASFRPQGYSARP